MQRVSWRDAFSGGLSDRLRAEIEEKLGRKNVDFRGFFGDACAVFLAQRLRGNTTVVELELSGGISAAGALALAESLGEHNTTLKQLRIHLCKSLGDDAAQAMADMLRKNATLQVFWMFDCSVGARGASALGEALAENTTLKKVAFSKNGEHALSDGGAQAMAAMLRKNTALEELNLPDCGVGDRGASALGEALKENTTLNSLYLGANAIGDDGAEALAEGLRWNETLTRLQLEWLTDTGASSLLFALRENNSTLMHLGFGFRIDNTKNTTIEDAIEEMLEENRSVVPATAERRARCLLFCCLQLAPMAHEHTLPSIGAVPVPVMKYAVEHAGQLHVAKRFEQGNAAVGQSSARVRARSSSLDGSIQ